MEFVHLHVHSHYSLLDGAVNLQQLVKAAAEYNMPALALTDHGNLFGAVKFYQACKAEGIKPIIGMEAYVAPGSRHEKKRVDGGAFFHFLLLARDEEGYQNLMKLSSLAYLEGFYYKPRIDKELLGKYSKGLIGSSACLSSEINRAAISGDDAGIRAQIESYRDLFDPGCFFLELQNNGVPEQERILEKIPPLAKEYGIPLIATNDIHYLRREDSRAQEVHLCINTGSTFEDSDRLRFDCDQFYFRSPLEMERVLGDFKEAIENTMQVAEMCNLDLDFESKHLPVFIIDDEEHKELDPTDYFRKLCVDGCRERYADFDENNAIQERLQYEIGVIENQGFASYFLITWDFIRYARENDVPVGPGRGSAAGSIVAYALGITNIDPLKYDLLFERFLNADRVSMPDIDIDFCMDGRERVIEYVKRKYGEDRVCQIITFGTMAARAVIRDVGRVLSVPLPEVDAIAKKIPAGPGVRLESSINADTDLQKMAKADDKLRELFDISLRLEGLNRHCSTHAAGVVIGDAPLIDTLPLYRNGDDITTQYVMEDLDAVGLLKMDFLGLRTLTVIDRAIRLVQQAQGITVEIDVIPLDDQNTFDLLCQGDTAAVFQLESSGMRDLVRRMKPDRFEDIIAVIALYRPGPLEGGMVDSYIERKHGREEMEFEHPLLEPILKETNGVILYQEQVMRIANQLGGFSLNEADTLRKAMGKKKKEIMEKYEVKFVDGAQAGGIDKQVAKRIFGLMEFFAGYGFNKSHSAAYALVTYQTAYLKANFPTEFMAAVMSCEMSNTDKIVEYLDECRRMEIEISPPNINRSERKFSVQDSRVWYGLGAVKGLGEKIVESFVAEQQKNGAYDSIFDFCERISGLTKSTVEILASCGAFDCLGTSRAKLASVIDTAISLGNQSRKDKERGQLDLFSSPGFSPASEGGGVELSYPDVEDWTDAERLSREKQTLGFYLSGHPLEQWQGLIDKYATHKLSDVERLDNGKPVTIAVQVSKLTKKVSKRSGEPFWIAVVEDLSTTIEVFVTKEQHETSAEFLKEEALVFLRGKVRYRDTTAGLRLEAFVPLEDAPVQLTKDVSLVVAIEDNGNAEDQIFSIKNLLQNNRGECPVYIVFKNKARERAIMRVGTENFVSPNRDFFQAADDLCGSNYVLVNRMARLQRR